MKTGDYFVGTAVIVDDKINDPNGSMAAVLDQLRNVGMPVMTRTELPDPKEVRHWGGYALIILDWELLSTGEVGVALPDTLQELNAAQLAAFVGRLLTELYCPIFILSSHDVEHIREELAKRLNVESEQIVSRVLIRSKVEVATDLVAALEEWVNEHPAVYALKSWELGYRDARNAMFSDFELSSGSWPQVLWAASKADSVNPHFELTEVISRNILHRFEPLVFDTAVLEAEGVAQSSVETVMRVVHRSAVVPAASLHSDVYMPGDFFFVPFTDNFVINVTAACDLVPRAGDGAIEMTVLPATRVPASEMSSQSQLNSLRKKNDPTTEYIWVLLDERSVFRVDFKGWRSMSSATLAPLRRGRLLDPYVVHLQQRFALHFQRQGLPRLPDVLLKA